MNLKELKSAKDFAQALKSQNKNLDSLTFVYTDSPDFEQNELKTALSFLRQESDS